MSKLIKSLNVNKATGLDGIGPRVLTLCPDSLSVPIASIINNSIASGIFPSMLKEACVFPIYKNGPKYIPSNYRPISILNTISKIFEKHVISQLNKYLQSNNLLHKTQSGFRKRHSCQTALTYLINNWTSFIDNGYMIGSVFLDLQKAFDLVDHNILLMKLKLYHFSNKTIDWFSSYLTNRYQVVKIGNEMSDKQKLQTGVPQGSILAPILFLLYINDLPNCITKSNLDLYADDSNLYAVGKTTQEIQTTLQTDVDLVIKWCNNNKMALNPQKSKVILIGSAGKIKKANALQITIENQIIENVESHNILGVTVDQTLSWSLHVQNVCKHMNSKLFLLNRISTYLNFDMRKLFYMAYILPIYDYCASVWGNCSHTDSNKIYRLQKRATKITFKSSKDIPTYTLFSKLGVLPFKQQVQYDIAIMTYKALNKELPEYINNLINLSSNVKYNLRLQSNRMLSTMQQHTNYKKKGFEFLSKTTWNSLPNIIKNQSTLVSFKKCLKMHLLNEHNESA